MAQRQTKGWTTVLEIAVVVILFWGVPAIAFWQFHTSFAAQDADSGSPFDNAAMFPRLVAIGLIGLGGLQIGRLIWMGAAGTDTSPRSRGLTLRALACLAAFVMYLFSVSTLGFVAATPAVLLAMFLILGARPLVAIGIAVLATATVGIVFGTILNVVLPVGRLGLPTLF